MTAQELRAQAEAKRTAARALHDAAEKENRDFTAEESTQFSSLCDEAKRLQSRADRAAAVGELDEHAGRPRSRRTDPEIDEDASDPEVPPKARKTEPATPKRTGRIRHFTGSDAEQKAYRFGQFCCALWGKQAAKKWCAEQGVPLMHASQSEGDNTAGGFLVPTEFDTDMIDLREQYGVFRRYARRSVMQSDTKVRNRRATGLTAYPVGEKQTITKSTKTWGQINLTAKKWGVIAVESNDLMEDAIINIGDDLAGEISYAFAQKEDDCGFNGDGTSTYHKIVGVRNALLNLSATRANIAGLVVGAGNLWSELLLTDFEAVVAKLPQYADTPNARWFCHKTFYWTVMAKLGLAAGGNTAGNISAGMPQQFLGYEVVFSQIFPKTEANDVVPCVLGDLALAADFGDRRSTSLSFAREGVVDSVNLWETDQFAIRGTERFDINVHDVGNASATAANREPGPIVGLLTAAS